MAKKALAVISFGTSYPEARAAIEHIEATLAAALPDHDFYRAFTSGMIIRKIEREEGIRIPTPEQLFEQLAAQGYDEVLCQSLHVIPGNEYDKMCAQIAPHVSRFAHLRIGKPLLWEQQDYMQCCQSLLTHMPALAQDEAFVFMGHGTDHFSNASYALAENTFRALGAERVYVGTVEGFPDFDYLAGRLRAHKVRRVYLAPFMIVAGDHAQNDLAGEDAESWKSMLHAQGYETEVLLRGLGEYPEIAAQFAMHLAQA